jgi:acyl-CoA reductase-like NAD-dependent aldehyde dehydrogenase
MDEGEAWQGRLHPAACQELPHFEPKGRMRIIAPWNYRFQLLMVPLVSATAAGNVVIVKPSNQTPATLNAGDGRN